MAELADTDPAKASSRLEAIGLQAGSHVDGGATNRSLFYRIRVTR